MSDVKVCPVCLGRGFVQSGFYSSTSGTYITSTTGVETCHSCNGKGYVIIPEYSIKELLDEDRS